MQSSLQLVVADYIQSELQLKAGRDKGDLEQLDGKPGPGQFCNCFYSCCECTRVSDKIASSTYSILTVLLSMT